MATNESTATNQTNRLSVSDHAKWRYLERINPTEPFPGTKIVQRFEDADAISIAGYDMPARLSESGDVVFLFDSNVHEVITLFEASDTQREHDIREASPSAGWKATYQAMGVDQ